MKIANDRHFASRRKQAFLDFGDGSRRFRHIHGDAHNFGSRFGKLKALLRCSGHIRRVRVGHGLHDDRRAPAHADVPHVHAVSLPPRMPQPSRIRPCNLCKHQPSILA